MHLQFAPSEDTFNYMEAVKDNGVETVRYHYYADGNRRQKLIADTGFVDTHHFYHGDQEIMEAERSSDFTSGDTLRRYIRLPNAVDEVLLMIDYSVASCSAGCAVYAQTDRLGSTIVTTDNDGDIVETYAYTPYGEAANDNAGFPFRFTGQKLDPETGLYYYKARYYDPALGRFLQTDPIGYEDQQNLYAYVHNDPVNNIDPTGMETVTSCADTSSTCNQGVGGETYSGGTPEENLEAANMAAASVNAALTGETGNEWTTVFDQNDDGSITASVSVSDNKTNDVSDAGFDIISRTTNPAGDQHTHPGLPDGAEYLGGGLSAPDTQTAEVVSTVLGKPFNRTVVDGPSGNVVSYTGTPGSVVRGPSGWGPSPTIRPSGTPKVIGNVGAIPYKAPGR